MATSMPHAFHPLVTPPPEQQNFRKPALPPSNHIGSLHSLNSLKRKAPLSDVPLAPLSNSNVLPPIIPPLQPHPTSMPSLGQAVPPPTQTMLSGMKDDGSKVATSAGAASTSAAAAAVAAAGGASSTQSLDPRYVSMVSRIAAYYQQRCQAISNAQQQRCQAWANMHRQKCQDTMQAAMLVVAWYIRDRIQRRRKKQKRAFRSGLRKQNAARSRVTKGESVRRWVMKVPKDTASPYLPSLDELLDESEANFSMDSEPPPPDKDAKLFETADQLIKSQYRKIEVPMLGILSFDESDSDNDSDVDEDMDDAPYQQRWDPRAGMGADGADEPAEGEEDDDDYEGEDYEEDVLDDDDDKEEHQDAVDAKEGKVQAHGSDRAQQGTATATGSRINTRSQSS
ncbi:hypothetical protein F5X68DRAFT_188704 [Plectosphaerella plurivora]|uniref:Uncharacterized protein n=1 Tax=Plectosphaerella plurivora TaxID=936078 RepID=A0A9P8VH92_9PEZI|nr:hypothetical protein F5X68DRAFT_188704 [Plectosphaerella plurivora]